MPDTNFALLGAASSGVGKALKSSPQPAAEGSSAAPSFFSLLGQLHKFSQDAAASTQSMSPTVEAVDLQNTIDAKVVPSTLENIASSTATTEQSESDAPMASPELPVWPGLMLLESLGPQPSVAKLSASTVAVDAEVANLGDQGDWAGKADAGALTGTLAEATVAAENDVLSEVAEMPPATSNTPLATATTPAHAPIGMMAAIETPAVVAMQHGAATREQATTKASTSAQASSLASVMSNSVGNAAAMPLTLVNPQTLGLGIVAEADLPTDQSALAQTMPLAVEPLAASKLSAPLPALNTLPDSSLLVQSTSPLADSRHLMQAPTNPVAIAQLPEQLVAMIRQHTPNLGEARVQLHPSELGAMDMQMKQDGQRLELTIWVDNEQSRRLLGDQFTQWRERLADAGFNLTQLDVSVRDQGTRQQGPRQDSDGTVAHAMSAPETPVKNPTQALLVDVNQGLDFYA